MSTPRARRKYSTRCSGEAVDRCCLRKVPLSDSSFRQPRPFRSVSGGMAEDTCHLPAGGGADGDPAGLDRSAGSLPPAHQPARDAARRVARSIYAALLRRSVLGAVFPAEPLQYHDLQLRLRVDRDRDRHGAGPDRGAHQHARPQPGVLRGDHLARRAAHPLHGRLAPAAGTLRAAERSDRDPHATASGHQRLLDVGHDPDRGHRLRPAYLSADVGGVSVDGRVVRGSRHRCGRQSAAGILGGHDPDGGAGDLRAGDADLHQDLRILRGSGAGRAGWQHQRSDDDDLSKCASDWRTQLRRVGRLFHLPDPHRDGAADLAEQSRAQCAPLPDDHRERISAAHRRSWRVEVSLLGVAVRAVHVRDGDPGRDPRVHLVPAVL